MSKRQLDQFDREASWKRATYALNALACDLADVDHLVDLNALDEIQVNLDQLWDGYNHAHGDELAEGQGATLRCDGRSPKV